MKKFQLLLIAIFLIPGAFAQVTFQKYYTSGSMEYGTFGRPTKDGGYIMTGATNTASREIYLVKTDPNGILQWSTIIGDSAAGIDFVYSVAEGIDGYVVCAWGNGAVVIKTDFNGIIQWSKIYDGGWNDVIVTSDTGYAIIGGFDSTYVGKIDSVGNLKWAKKIVDTEYGEASRIVQNADGSFTIAASQSLEKIDAYGNLIWRKTFGGQDIRLTFDGGYILTGVTSPENPSLIKTDSAGNIQWAKAYGPNYGWGVSVCQTLDSGFVVCCSLTTAIVFKTDKNGEIVWAKDYSGNNYSAVMCIHTTSDGGLMIFGSYDFYSGGFLLAKTDANGNTDCPVPDLTLYDSSITFTVDTGGTIVNAGSQSNAHPFITALGTTENVVCPLSAIPEAMRPSDTITIYPDPVDGQLSIRTYLKEEDATVSIFNVMGQQASPPTPLLWRGEDAVIDVSKLPAGMYFLQMKSEDRSVVKKFVKK